MKRYCVHMYLGEVHGATFVNADSESNASQKATSMLGSGLPWIVRNKPHIVEGSPGEPFMVALVRENTRVAVFLQASSSEDAVEKAKEAVTNGTGWTMGGNVSEVPQVEGMES